MFGWLVLLYVFAITAVVSISIWQLSNAELGPYWRMRFPEVVQMTLTGLLAPYLAFLLQRATTRQGKKLDVLLKQIEQVESKFSATAQDIFTLIGKAGASGKPVEPYLITLGLKQVSTLLSSLSSISELKSGEPKKLLDEIITKFEALNKAVTGEKWRTDGSQIDFDTEKVLRIEKLIEELGTLFQKLKIAVFQ